jgi:heptosyltransferase-1
MPRTVRTVLLVKTSSLGDVVHNLPVVTDIRRSFPEAHIDWVVEGAFAAIPALHPGVGSVISCELRRWRQSWLRRSTRDEWRAFLKRLRSEHYDCIIDTQGLFKSAIVARAARGKRVGLDWKSSREPLRPLYDRVVNVSWRLHAVERNRRLASAALGYTLCGEADYGIRAKASFEPWLPDRPYAVFLHGASSTSKLWPPECWIELGSALCLRGLSILLPWGSEQEREAALSIASRLPKVRIAPRLPLAELASVIVGARGAVGVDTGLTHLAAALGVTTIGIYGATDPAATGIRSQGLTSNLGTRGRFPSVAEVLSSVDRLFEAESRLFEATQE